jgi:hypothetical protein
VSIGEAQVRLSKHEKRTGNIKNTPKNAQMPHICDVTKNFQLCQRLLFVFENAKMRPSNFAVKYASNFQMWSRSPEFIYYFQVFQKTKIGA